MVALIIQSNLNLSATLLLTILNYCISGYAWFLDGVSVYDMFDKRIYEFQCNKWLSGQDGDKKIYRDLKLDRERGFVDGMYLFSRHHHLL